LQLVGQTIEISIVLNIYTVLTSGLFRFAFKKSVNIWEIVTIREILLLLGPFFA